ncbi:MAG TPA: hypothetical protein VLM43_18665 [Desulfobacterales bacterium]|jgi:hypothetical protein|nr:hypothetical protein [Desulfobacterales bacterium]
MIKLGPATKEMRAMLVNDIFLSRLKLLIIMAKACLKNYPMGRYRKSSIIDNAHYVFYHSLHLISQTSFSENHESERCSEIASEMDIEDERELHQRVQLLAVMVKAVAENRLTDNFRKKAFQENLDRICDILTLSFHIKDLEFLKVA